MMKRIFVGALVVILAAPAASAGDLTDSINRAAREAAQPTPKPSGGFPNEKLVWTGAVLIAIGVTVAIVATTTGADETVICSGVGNSVGCTDTKQINKGALWGGVGAAGVGAVLVLMGVKTHAPDVTIQRRSLMVSKNVRF